MMLCTYTIIIFAVLILNATSKKLEKKVLKVAKTSVTNHSAKNSNIISKIPVNSSIKGSEINAVDKSLKNFDESRSLELPESQDKGSTLLEFERLSSIRRSNGHLQNNPNIRKNKYHPSFLEIHPEDSLRKHIINNISNRFSAAELKKIRSLIAFAKNNNLLDKIIDNNGDVSVGDLMKSRIVKNFTASFKNVTGNFSSNQNEMIKNIESLKLMQIMQQAKLSSYFNQINSNVNSLKELMLITKNFNKDFQSQLLSFGANLKLVNEEVDHFSGKVDSLFIKSKDQSNKALINTEDSVLKASVKSLQQKVDSEVSKLLKNEKITTEKHSVKPISKGHVLLIPTRVVKKFADLTETEVMELFISAKKIGQNLKSHYKTESIQYAIQNGEEAGILINKFMPDSPSLTHAYNTYG